MTPRYLLLAVSLVAGQATADPLQDQVLAGIRASNTTDIAFTETTRITRTGMSAKELVTRYDPRAAPGSRWSLLRVDGHAPTAKEIADFARHAGKQPSRSYARLAEWFGAPAARVAQSPGSVTYRFARLPGGVVKMGSHDASADTVADAVVNTSGPKPFVERVRFTSSTAFRMMLVAKVERYVFSASYGLLPDSRVFPTGADVDMTGSLMGKAETIETRTRYSEVKAGR